MNGFRTELAAAYQNMDDARERLKLARAAVRRYFEDNPPKSFRLQEAMKNQDGTFDLPHWDEVALWDSQALIDQEELQELVLNEGTWIRMFDSCEGDDRPGYRRVIDMVWET